MQQETNISDGVFHDIASGKYREGYLIYNRKSTDDTDNQKNSIKYQKAENSRFAARHNLSIAHLTIEGFCTDGIVSERHSGFKEDIELVFGNDNTVQYRVDRPKFHRLVQLLNAGDLKGVIFLCWDRASRNKGDDTILRKLMKAGVDVRFTLAQYDKTSSGELHMDIDGMFAEHHSRVTREKVTVTFRNARSRGLCTNRAPVGYLNQGSMEYKPQDPLRAPIIRQLFEMAATGEWSLSDLARWSIEQGFTMPPMRRRRTEAEVLAEEEDDVRLQITAVSRLATFNSIHKILTNPFYMGKVPGNDGFLIQSTSHEPIVAPMLFYKVQEQLRHRNTSAHYDVVIDQPLRGILRCGECRRVYTPYAKKGRTYYGARCGSNCSNPTKSISFELIAAKIGQLVENLSFTDDELAEIDARASTDIALLEAKRIGALEAAERRKKTIRENLAYLHANRLTMLRAGAYTAESFVDEERNLNTELEALKQDEDTSDVSMRETVRDIFKLSELLKSGLILYTAANPYEKERIIRIIFSELTLFENTLDYRCKNGFEALASRFLPNYDPIGWLSELSKSHAFINLSLHELTNMSATSGHQEAYV